MELSSSAFDGEILVSRLLDAYNVRSSKSLAEKINRPTSTVSNWKRGIGFPKRDELSRIVEETGIDLDYLFGLTDEPAPPAPVGEALQSAPDTATAAQKLVVGEIADLIGTLSALQRKVMDDPDFAIRWRDEVVPVMAALRKVFPE